MFFYSAGYYNNNIPNVPAQHAVEKRWLGVLAFTVTIYSREYCKSSQFSKIQTHCQRFWSLDNTIPFRLRTSYIILYTYIYCENILFYFRLFASKSKTDCMQMCCNVRWESFLNTAVTGSQPLYCLLVLNINNNSSCYDLTRKT